MLPFRPHDLLFLRLPDRFDAGGAWPDWLDIAWLMRAPLVVRRDVAPGSLVPVGARGTARNQRCKGQVQRAAVTRCVTPESLAHAPLPSADTLPALPALHTLALLAPRLAALGLAWGPTGGAGFQLASGLPVLRPDSDLDLVVRAPTPLSAHDTRQLLALQQDAPCRIDVQVDTGWGGFALADYARGGRVLLKTARGPLLVADPWHHAAAA